MCTFSILHFSKWYIPQNHPQNTPLINVTGVLFSNFTIFSGSFLIKNFFLDVFLCKISYILSLWPLSGLYGSWLKNIFTCFYHDLKEIQYSQRYFLQSYPIVYQLLYQRCMAVLSCINVADTVAIMILIKDSSNLFVWWTLIPFLWCPY